MAYTALYREWRPKDFKDMIGQEHITTTLKNQIENDRIAHAYIFCGTRGTGKTTTAKIMAKALNCLNPVNGEPCNECEMCKKINSGLAIDVTELDAASNNGIDKIRDIIDDVKYPPQEAKYKVYIMDEVHMLSMGAVNAFLKTLEEPPENVVFILATTDPQKLPITILSRCQRFDFKRFNVKDIYSRLRTIVDAKGILAEDKSLQLIARTADGAMRDALSILDQAIAMGNGSIDYNEVVNMLGLVTNDNLFKMADAVIERSVEGAINVIEDVVLSGKDVYLFIKDLVGHYRNLLMSKVTNNPEEVLDMSSENIALIKEQGARIRTEEIMRDIRILQETEASARLSKEARLYLELAIIKMCKIEYDTSSEIMLARLNRLEEVIKSGKIKVSKVSAAEATNNQTKAAGAIKKQANTAQISAPKITGNSEAKSTLDDVKRSWTEILESFKARRAMIIFASISTGRPIDCSNGIITVQYDDQYSFNKDRLEKPDNYKVVNEVVSEVLGEQLKVRFVVKKSNNTNVNPEDALRDTFGDIDFEILDE